MSTSSPSSVPTKATSSVSAASVAGPVAELRRATAVVWSVAGLVVGAVVGFLIGDVIGLVVGMIVLGAVACLVGLALVGRFIEGALGSVMAHQSAREIDADDSPRLFNLLQGLCATAGVSTPRVALVDDASINVFVAADPAHIGRGELVVTRGLVESLERIEMEGVVAVCLARLRSGLAEAQTVAEALSVSSPWFVPGPVRRRIVSAAGSGQAIFDADVKGVGITRYPPGLASAFQKMLGASTAVAAARAGGSLLWLANPSGESDGGADDETGNAARRPVSGSRVDASNDERPPLAERLALLREI